MKKRVFLAWLVVLSLLLAACGGGSAAAPTTAPAPTEAPTVAPAASNAVTSTTATTTTAAMTATTATTSTTPMTATKTTTATSSSGGGQTAASTGNIKEIKILWAQWDPADYLQEVGKLYEEKTGIKVTVVQEPWGSFYNRAFTEFAAKGNSWDMIVGDSQWLGQAATEGIYVDLTDFLKSNGIDKTVTPATLTYYGEYPAASGKYYAYPTEGDADGWAYRKDWFENPDEQKAFKAKYGYDLAVPKTWQQLLDISKFFTRPDKNMYGSAIYTQKDYDAITMGFENVMFSYGVQWQDPKTNGVKGIVNSDAAVKALEFYKDLYTCCQPKGMVNAFFQETNDAFIKGQVAMAMNYFAFFPALANEQTNPQAKNTGYFANPAGPDGQSFAALGGQGISVISFTSKERQQASLDFIKWFAQEENQKAWADLGGYTCNANVLKSADFLKVAPYNAAFAETMTKVKDFWNIPIYAQLLEVTQRELSSYVVGGEGTAKEHLDKMADAHDKILRDNKLIK